MNDAEREEETRRLWNKAMHLLRDMEVSLRSEIALPDNENISAIALSILVGSRGFVSEEDFPSMLKTMAELLYALGYVRGAKSLPRMNLFINNN